MNEPIISIVAEDPDLDVNGTLIYMVAASNLYKFGVSKSSGSVVPSPFNITQDGKWSSKFIKRTWNSSIHTNIFMSFVS